MKRTFTLTIARIAAVSAILVLARPVHAQPRDPGAEFAKHHPKILSAFRELVAVPSLSTVRITCGGSQAAMGTVVGSDGLILTKFSELKADPICKLADGSEYGATVIGIHEKYDLALLQIGARGLAPIKWADSKSTPVGHWIACPGHGIYPVAVGVVSVAARNLPPAPTRPGPNPNAGYLGIGFDVADVSIAKISQVMPDTPALRAGLKANDVILALNSKTIEGGIDAFQAAIGQYRPNDVVTLKVKRGDEEKEFKVTLGKRPADRGTMQNNLGSILSEIRNGFPTVLQHDSVIQAHECGGPLVDLEGLVIGINIARAGRTETYAVPGEEVQKLLPDMIAGKYSPQIIAARKVAAKKVADAKLALQKAEKEARDAQKKLDDAKKALEQAEKDARESEKVGLK